MDNKLQQGDRFPEINFNLVDGRSLSIPSGGPSRYTALLFYRGHW